MTGPALSVSLGQSSQQAGSQSSTGRFLKLRKILLLLLRLLRVLNDGVPVEGSAKVDLKDGGELVRVDEVNDGDSSAHEDTETAGHQDQPEAPAEVEHEDGLLQSDEQGPSGQQFEVDEVAEKQREPCEGDQVRSVSRDNDQH